MDKKIIEQYKGKCVEIILKPKGFGLTGVIEEIFEDCFKFRTPQRESYLDFALVMSIVEASDKGKTYYFTGARVR